MDAPPKDKEPPFLDALGIGVQVWYVGGHCLEHRAEKCRQAHQRRLHVEIGQRLCFGYQLIDAGARAEEIQEHAGALDHDPAAALFHHRGVADELDRVAQALLGIEQDGAAV